MKDPYGNDITLWELRGKPAVIVFSPFTFTGTLQGEQCEIRDDPSAFERGGAQVLAISWDSRHSQRIWAEEQGVTFPVLSDFWPHGAVAKEHGVFNDALGCADRARSSSTATASSRPPSRPPISARRAPSPSTRKRWPRSADAPGTSGRPTGELPVNGDEPTARSS